MFGDAVGPTEGMLSQRNFDERVCGYISSILDFMTMLRKEVMRQTPASTKDRSPGVKEDCYTPDTVS